MNNFRSAFLRSSLITLIALLLWGLMKLELRAQNPVTQSHPYASNKPIPEPVLFGEGIVSTAGDDLNAAFSPDGKTVYFSKNVPVNRMGVILYSEHNNGRWSAPEVAPFSGQYSDYDPFFSHDGSKLFYISNRPVEAGKPKRDYDIWVVEKTANGWREARNLGGPINTEKDEFYPSLAADGTLVFSANRAGTKGGFDLYKSKLVDGKYTEPENMGDAINSQFAEIDSYIAPDQSFIVFASYGRPDELGRGDLYISYYRNGAWTKAVNLGNKINSSAREYCPIGSPDGKYFFFTSFRGFADKTPEKPLTYQ
ncbi:MAG TPA: hypothetical protein VNO70_06040, partial [Blastocatellia bacterium]|nr:hypothetical protein [Blastocatellia bacterium]